MECKKIPFFSLEGINFFIDYIKNRIEQSEHTEVFLTAFEWVKAAYCNEDYEITETNDMKLYKAWSAAEYNHHNAKMKRDAMLMTVWRYTMVAVDSYRQAVRAAA